MTLSVILTTRNDGASLGACLDSLRPCLRPGDQLVLVDDGSTGAAEAIVTAFANGDGHPQAPQPGEAPDHGPVHGVHRTPVMFGTRAGPGIARNIGLDHARGDTVVFLDGSDRLIPEAFLHARGLHVVQQSDIHLTGYQWTGEDETGNLIGTPTGTPTGRTSGHMPDKGAAHAPVPPDPVPVPIPAHSARFPACVPPELQTGPDIDAARRVALGLPAAPLCGFYRRAFLVEQRIRFDESGTDGSEHPFHWQTCLRADRISTSPDISRWHQPPDLPDDPSGTAFMAVLARLPAILGMLPAGQDALRAEAARWLVRTMTDNIARLPRAAFWPCALHARDALRRLDPADWAALLAVAPTEEMDGFDRLRQGDVRSTVADWHSRADRRAQATLARRVAALENRIAGLAAQVGDTQGHLRAHSAIAEFAALRDLAARNS